MKKYVFTLTVFVISTGLFAQVLTTPPKEREDDGYRTIFDNQEIRVGAFGGPMMSFTIIDGEFSHMMGGGGGILVGGFYFGGYGQGLTNNIPANSHYGANDYIEFGHGGFMTGYTIMGKTAVHPTINTLIGWGSISISDNYNVPADESGAFIFEPSLQLELNFTRFFRVALGAGYRFVSNLNLEGYSNTDFSKPSVSLSFKFGWF